MVVSEPGRKKLRVIYQAFCKTCLSLLLLRQKTEGAEVFKHSHMYVGTNTRRQLYTDSKVLR